MSNNKIKTGIAVDVNASEKGGGLGFFEIETSIFKFFTCAKSG